MEKRGQERLQKLGKGEATEGMSDQYFWDPRNRCIRRKYPRQHLSKKERRRLHATKKSA